MNTNPNNPASTVLDELNQHIRSIKSLLNQLEPSRRLEFVNEMMVKLIPSHLETDSAQDRLNRKYSTPNKLTAEENKLIEKLSKDTLNLYRSNHEDDLL